MAESKWTLYDHELGGVFELIRTVWISQELVLLPMVVDPWGRLREVPGKQNHTIEDS